MSPLAARDPNETDEERNAAQAGEELAVLTEIDHVAFAVHDIFAALDTYREAFGAVVEHREVLDDEGIDVAFLPMNLPYTMTPEMVADAARAFRPRVLYPYHFGETDPQKLVSLLADEKGIEVRVRRITPVQDRSVIA